MFIKVISIEQSTLFEGDVVRYNPGKLDLFAKEPKVVFDTEVEYTKVLSPDVDRALFSKDAVLDVIQDRITVGDKAYWYIKGVK